MKAKKGQVKYRRGDSSHYRNLQAKSIKSRINRNIIVEIVKDKKRVTVEPCRVRTSDAGFDLTACEDVMIPAGCTARIPTGVRVCCPEGYFYLMLGRSGMNSRGLVNVTGVIDAGYQGELFALLHNTTTESQTVEVGHRVAQIVFFPQIHPSFIERDEFTESTPRGTNGWGSSGN